MADGGQERERHLPGPASARDKPPPLDPVAESILANTHELVNQAVDRELRNKLATRAEYEEVLHRVGATLRSQLPQIIRATAGQRHRFDEAKRAAAAAQVAQAGSQRLIQSAAGTVLVLLGSLAASTAAFLVTDLHQTSSGYVAVAALVLGLVFAALNRVIPTAGGSEHPLLRGRRPQEGAGTRPGAMGVLALVVGGTNMAAGVFGGVYEPAGRVPVALSVIGVAFVAVAVAAGRARLATRASDPQLRRWRSDDPGAWPPANPDARRLAERARVEWLRAVIELGVQPILTAELDRLRRSYAIVLPPDYGRPIVEITDVTQYVSTAAYQRLLRLRRSMPAASIGVSGPRGSGKSALLEYVSDARFRSAGTGIALLVQAPTRYDAREFLLDLFAEFCRQVIGPQGSADVIRSVEQGDGTQLWQHRLLARAMVLAGTGAVLAALAWPQLSTAAASAAGNPRLVVGVLGGLVAGAGLVLMWRRSRLRRVAVVPETVTGLARRHLETLTYLRTHSREWAATGRATALHLARKRGLQHAARAHTYPELVREFRTFVETVGLDRRAQYGDEAITTICIDELDKIGSAEEAENFLNEIKAIFGVSNTHYLISISKEALVSFDRRALGVRATFDSSFDLVLTMSLLRFAEARELLAKRLTRMPEPFVALCYSLSGGLPRDLLRMARDLQDTTAEDADGGETPAKPPSRPLAPLAERLIDGDVRGIIEGQVLHLGRVPSPAARPALRWMVNVTNAPLSADTLLGAAIKPPDVVKAGTETADCAEVVRLTQQTAAYFYLAATLRALFCDRPAGLAAWMREHEDETEVLDGLAAARADLSTHPLTTWHRLREVRRRFRLAIHDFPFG